MPTNPPPRLPRSPPDGPLYTLIGIWLAGLTGYVIGLWQAGRTAAVSPTFAETLATLALFVATFALAAIALRSHMRHLVLPPQLRTTIIVVSVVLLTRGILDNAIGLVGNAAVPVVAGAVGLLVALGAFRASG